MLPQNILNEKMFVVYWFWFYLVLIFSAIAVLYRILVIAFPSVRLVLLTRLRRRADPEDVEIILDNSTYPDYFLIHLVCFVNIVLVQVDNLCLCPVAWLDARPNALPRCAQGVCS